MIRLSTRSTETMTRYTRMPRARLTIGLVAAGLLVAAVPLHRSVRAGTGSSSVPVRHGGSSDAAVRLTGLLPQDTATKLRMLDTYGKLPLAFEANHGQTDSRVHYLARGSGYTVFLTAAEAVLALEEPAAHHTPTPGAGHTQAETAHAALAIAPPLEPTRAGVRRRSGDRSADTPRGDPAVVRLQLVGARAAAPVLGLQELRGTRNYFIGNDPQRWHTQVPTYTQVRYQEPYPGIDLIYYGNQHQLEYDFVVAPGADPTAITLRLAGARQLRIDANGDLVGQLGASWDGGHDPEVRWHKPVVYQMSAGEMVQEHRPADLVAVSTADAASGKTFLEGRYVLKGDEEVAFAVAAYDRARPLIIDPVLSYSTYLGGSDDDGGHGIAVDSAGNAYVTGRTKSTDFPTSNPLQPTNHSSATGCATIGPAACGPFNAFVAKLDPAGTTLLYATYLGGSGLDEGHAIAVDSAGNAYVTGQTGSTDFPTSNPFQPTHGGGDFDAFVAALDPAGATLRYSTYLGGGGDDAAFGIAVDSAGNAYVTGQTFSTDFPTSNPLQPTFGGGDSDAFVTALDPAGATLRYSTFLGGSERDEGRGIAVDTAGNAYVTGETASTDFPTSNPLQPKYGGGRFDAFVAALDPAGTTLRYATYLGGSEFDRGYDIAVDSAGSAYVSGWTASTDFPTSNALQPTFGGGIDDAFVAKLDSAGITLLYATYLGGSGSDRGDNIGVDSAGNAYVTGRTQSVDFPTANPLQAALAGNADVFVTALDSTGATFLYSTYLGGSGTETGIGLAVDSAGNAYVTGSTTSPDFPTANPLQPAFGGGVSDAFVAKIAP